MNIKGAGTTYLSKDVISGTEKGDVNGLRSRDPKRLREACQGVEAMFLNMMLKEMRNTIPKSGLFHDSLQKDIYTSLFDQHLAQEASQAGKGVGIADMLFEYLSAKR